MLQNGAVTAPGYAGGDGPISQAARRLDECQRGMLLNATSAAAADVTSDGLYGSLHAAPASLKPPVTLAHNDQHHQVHMCRQVRILSTLLINVS